MKLSAQDLTTLITALNVAIPQYDLDAKELFASGQERLAQQFQKQALEARDLREKIERAYGE